ncbi:hypothetical protein [Carboxylicivirga caseinilyticus]|uniref:hypothetical protein n=1 Tax=Carboxylicivirga caseinilyticus TaxID=3417572 RepID=UPI003D340D37|nr:hypothetical protein [Marinilabiliaceae bacterium A049]
MAESKTLIEQGFKYCKHVEGFKTSKLLTIPILVNMAGMAGECLLGGLSQKYQLIADHGDIISHLTLLKTVLIIPEDVETASQNIARTTTMCSINTNDEIVLGELANDIKILKEWVADKIREV